MDGKLSFFATFAGRLLMAAVFLQSGFGKVLDFGGTAEGMAKQGMPLVQPLLVGAIAIELIGGLMLLAGFKARWAAAFLLLFLVVATYFFHDFWYYTGQEKMVQEINFMKNLAIMGGLFLITGFGAGGLSVDNGLALVPPEPAQLPAPAQTRG